MLKVRWQIYAAAQKWEAELDIAAALVRLTPEEASGWVNRSFSPPRPLSELAAAQRFQDTHATF
ncbi:MAG: hypothetical protein ACLQM8_09385 [Limisphaerales bacterium]